LLGSTGAPNHALFPKRISSRTASRRYARASPPPTRASTFWCSVRAGSKDFFWKASIRDLEANQVPIDIHHIFPKKWCENNGVKPAEYDSIINRTPISYKANRMIGGNAPSRYLMALQNHKQVGLDNAAMEALLESHRIDPESLCEFRRNPSTSLMLIDADVGPTLGKNADVYR
jgi:hypothetical protein